MPLAAGDSGPNKVLETFNTPLSGTYRCKVEESFTV